MSDLYKSSQPFPATSQGGKLRVILGSATLAFLAGGAVVGWLVWDGRLALPDNAEARPAAVAQPALPGPAPSAAAAHLTGTLLEQQVAALEQRLARIDLQAAAAEGNTARTEAMLVALAARRAIERGDPLGYLEDQLKLRFGAARPAAVNTVVAAAKNPVTLPQLAGELDALTPALTGTNPDESGWTLFRNRISGMFIVHRDNRGSGLPAARIAHAQLLLRTGQIDAAIDEVSRLPGSAAASVWIAKARRYSEAGKALDQIEQAALAEPEKLKAGTGEEIRQPGPGVSPSPTANANPAASASAGSAVF
ncbi:MAG: hypothetical protein J0M19_03585 [Sphingomonadales bacterium]|nr:hypothetical protein [Sphingomonadales bacterium]